MRHFLVAVLLTVSSVAMADLVDNNKLYTTCDTCVTDQDFMSHALSVRYPGAPNTVLVVNSTNHTSFSSINPGVVKKVVVTGGFPLGEPTASLQPLHSFEESMYNLYLNYLETYKNYYFFTTTHNVGKVQIEPSLTSSMVWLGNTDFATEYKSAFNSAVNQTNFNPFLFIEKSLTIQVKTQDNYTIELYRDYRLYTNNWYILKARNANGDLVDNSGNVIDPLTTQTAPEFCSADYCEMSCKTVNSSSGNPTAVLPFFDTYNKQTPECLALPQPSGPGKPPPIMCSPTDCPDPGA